MISYGGADDKRIEWAVGVAIAHIGPVPMSDLPAIFEIGRAAIAAGADDTELYEKIKAHMKHVAPGFYTERDGD